MLLNNADEPLLLALRRSALLRPGDRVLVAISGGPDSTALLVAAQEIGLDVVAAHYDHALQKGSAGVAEHVASLCRRWHIELVSERRTLPLTKGSVQAAARALRYEFLERARNAMAADAVALAHNADDVVEGVVLHLMRGCGLAGLRGMPASRGVFIRPMLPVWRTEVAEFLSRRGIVALEDPANANTAYARVHVRRGILPALERDRPGLRRRFYAVAQRATSMQESIAIQAASALNGSRLARAAVAGSSQPVAAELMKMLYAQAGGPQPSLSRLHLKSMLRLAQPGPGGRGVDLPGGLRLRIVGETMEIVADQTASARQDRPSLRLEIMQCSGCADQDVAHVKAGLELRLGFRQPGLTMRPQGGRGTRKLQDIFVDARVPREDRDTWPLIFAADKLAWVPGVAIDADLATIPGTPGQHVSVVPYPPMRKPKIAMLESPHSPSGEPS
ncbi:MAG TPA: tRNA lysidine(34) synthetase TilS [Candidatus Acidoferrum sp.]|jgi:tRNA(Ile)-lysidine synthetase-like protein|nr:tRNA lysidine(34) synthetase TilS [Candidatus Acidoferrum sp.]